MKMLGYFLKESKNKDKQHFNIPYFNKMQDLVLRIKRNQRTGRLDVSLIPVRINYDSESSERNLCYLFDEKKAKPLSGFESAVHIEFQQLKNIAVEIDGYNLKVNNFEYGAVILKNKASLVAKELDCVKIYKGPDCWVEFERGYNLDIIPINNEEKISIGAIIEK